MKLEMYCVRSYGCLNIKDTRVTEVVFPHLQYKIPPNANET